MAEADCTCTRRDVTEFWAGEPVTVIELIERDRRCPEHGKPRWSDAEKESR